MKTVIAALVLAYSLNAAANEIDTIFAYAKCSVALKAGSIVISKGKSEMLAEAERVQQKAFAFFKATARGNKNREYSYFDMYAKAVDDQWAIFEASDGNAQVMLTYALDGVKVCKQYNF